MNLKRMKYDTESGYVNLRWIFLAAALIDLIKTTWEGLYASWIKAR